MEMVIWNDGLESQKSDMSSILIVEEAKNVFQNPNGTQNLTYDFIPLF